jgi:hypothetical protein
MCYGSSSGTARAAAPKRDGDGALAVPIAKAVLGRKSWTSPPPQEGFLDTSLFSRIPRGQGLHCETGDAHALRIAVMAEYATKTKWIPYTRLSVSSFVLTAPTARLKRT